MTQWLRVLVAILEDWSSVPSTLVGLLTTPAAGGWAPSSGLLGYLHAHEYTETHT